MTLLAAGISPLPVEDTGMTRIVWVLLALGLLAVEAVRRASVVGRPPCVTVATEWVGVEPATDVPDRTTSPPVPANPLTPGLTVMAVGVACVTERMPMVGWPGMALAEFEVTSMSVVGVGVVEGVDTRLTRCMRGGARWGCEPDMEGCEELEDSSSSMSMWPRLTAELRSWNWRAQERVG